MSFRIKKFKNLIKDNNAKLIDLGIGDVTRPIAEVVSKAIKNAADELRNINKFHGYGPELGYDFLKEKILFHEYKNFNFDLEEIFISDGIASDIGNILDLFDNKNTVAIFDPVYPEYLDTNLMNGRKIYFLDCNSDNYFCPEVPNHKIDLIYICNPNNPTGTTLNKRQLEKWINYAINNNSIIFYDAAYEKFINSDEIPNSIYEIKNAEKCAIEFRSFSKYASFTGIRCGYTILPKKIKHDGYILNNFWSRRQSTKTNGVSYISQKAAEAIFTSEGLDHCSKNISYYKNNANILKKHFKNCGYDVYGGDHSPYLWTKIPDKFNNAWDFFDFMLEKFNIIITPGIGFGKNGKKYFRLSAFCNHEDILKTTEIVK
jgi:LL-diaminopimelate aminotransferase